MRRRDDPAAVNRAAAIAVRTTAALLVAALLGWHLLGLTLSMQRLHADPAAAHAWAPQSAAAAADWAQQRFDAGDTAAASRLARAALIASPLTADAYRVLAEVALRSGASASAEARLRIAARLDPRDAATQAWLAAAALRDGHLEAALWHLDAILRVHPTLAARLYPQLLALARVPGAAPAYRAVFAAHPPWGGDFFRWACVQPASADAPVRVLFAALRAVPDALHAADWSAYLDRLIGQRRWLPAYMAWVESLPPAQQQHLDNIFDGDFQYPPSGRGFDWRISYVPGAEIGVVPRATASGNALQVRFLDQRAPLAGQVAQLLVLAPGRYRVSGQARLHGVQNDRGLQWVLSCADNGRQLGASARMRGSLPWHDFAFDVEVPAQGCGAQWLSLRLAWRIPAEQWADGRAEFTGLRALRLAPGH